MTLQPYEESYHLILAHAFTAFTGAVPAADVACREVAGLVREGFEGRVA